MDKKLILAVAGSGKTYTLCNEINPSERNLILAYTNENIKNIYNEIIKQHNEIPKFTIITTFDSYILNNIAKPFASYVAQKNDNRYVFDEYGCAYNLELPRAYDNKTNTHHYQFKKDKLAHYITKTGKFYGERIPKFINNFNLIVPHLVVMKKHFDKIYIDEVQDFAGERFILLQDIIKNFDNLLLVGDFHQHSVSTRIDPDGKLIPFNKNISYQQYKKIFTKMGVQVDDTSLLYSRRCPEEVCALVNDKLGIDIKSSKQNTGNVIIINNEEEARAILENNSIIKLVHKNSKEYPFRAINWGYSKGDTYGQVCVILNDNMEQFTESNFNHEELPASTKNKFYVALTRTKGDLFIMPYSIFKKCIKS